MSPAPSRPPVESDLAVHVFCPQPAKRLSVLLAQELGRPLVARVHEYQGPRTVRIKNIMIERVQSEGRDINGQRDADSKLPLRGLMKGQEP
ncbi:hypothetical protein ACRE_015380 [Hapsidospora chrysogenum ATCC 11550]|uniref:Uncharacterized protein n=1 Tax=Hapsidospora chrysogenum (strain ATCC 11550 / CBS 779.69 / DSM 880 / IAM 14645 / JCM 23072 / IMI 49137) TaxID=857340 RepID=A0A086TE16_HAPC1|nr:hypothetical protein ACRE_015380 [Hapsidospora chrysogenum ATCC 11550]